MSCKRLLCSSCSYFDMRHGAHFKDSHNKISNQIFPVFRVPHTPVYLAVPRCGLQFVKLRAVNGRDYHNWRLIISRLWSPRRLRHEYLPDIQTLLSHRWGSYRRSFVLDSTISQETCSQGKSSKEIGPLGFFFHSIKNWALSYLKLSTIYRWAVQ